MVSSISILSLGSRLISNPVAFAQDNCVVEVRNVEQRKMSNRTMSVKGFSIPNLLDAIVAFVSRKSDIKH